MFSNRTWTEGDELPPNFILLGLHITPSTLLPWAIEGNPFHVPVYPGVNVARAVRLRLKSGRSTMPLVSITDPIAFELVSRIGTAAPTSTTCVTDPTLSMASMLVVFVDCTSTS